MSADSMSQLETKVPTESRVGRWMTIIGVWSLFGIWYANQVFFSMKMRGMHHFYWRVFVWGLLVLQIWSLLTPLILWAATRFPVERPRVLKSLAAHLGLLILVIAFVSSVETSLTMLIHPFDPISDRGPFQVQLVGNLPGSVPFCLFLYATVCGVGHALEYRRRAREKELQAAKLEALLSKSQVLALKMQLHPHFLFNTLNGIVALVREGDNDAAVKMLLGLSNMLRYALESSGRQEVPLSEELEFLSLYLSVEQMRFPDRLQVEMAIDKDAEQAMVPSLMLQPLVENAIRHGIAPRSAKGLVRVAARREGETLIVNIEDDGVGLKESCGAGVGLSNTRSRLEQLYPGAYEFSIDSRAPSGVIVALCLPFQTENSAEFVSRRDAEERRAAKTPPSEVSAKFVRGLP